MLQIAELILHGVTLRSRLPRKGLIGVAIFTSRSMAGCGGDSAGIRRVGAQHRNLSADGWVGRAEIILESNKGSPVTDAIGRVMTATRFGLMNFPVGAVLIPTATQSK